ncbi:hypothetical protein [Phormidium sp. CCY1219]|uniref:hypothetical protein n=1 Tax=Phormidium sp. CCY1219 TaxID=2886104 RepID=UPI002D1F64C9|nr:hypothetical protein [Phormidium sp. CCY1219]MEB3830942.1 hypothetical protein [Phormidium sp. CCY1219]
MQSITWHYGSNNPENPDHFDTIRRWWSNLNGKEVTWRQRIIPASGEVTDLDWEPQRFDEQFVISNPEVRGITLYWRKPGTPDPRNTTVSKLELDRLRQELYIYPQSQPTLVIRVGVAAIQYKTVKLKEAEIVFEGNTLILRDRTQLLEVKTQLTSQQIGQFKEQLPE